MGNPGVVRRSCVVFERVCGWDGMCLSEGCPAFVCAVGLVGWISVAPQCAPMQFKL